jgi:hypothetical protein
MGLSFGFAVFVSIVCVWFAFLIGLCFLFPLSLRVLVWFAFLVGYCLFFLVTVPLIGLLFFLVGWKGAVRWNVCLSGAESGRKERNSDLNC